jgi:hypothetical protein
MLHIFKFIIKKMTDYLFIWSFTVKFGAYLSKYINYQKFHTGRYYSLYQNKRLIFVKF